MNMACLNAGIRYLYDAWRVVNRRAERTLAVVGARRRGALPRRVVEEGAAAFAVVSGSAVPAVAHQAAVFPNAARRVAVALAPGACSPRGHEHILLRNCGPGRERLPPQPSHSIHLPILHTNFCNFMNRTSSCHDLTEQPLTLCTLFYGVSNTQFLSTAYSTLNSSTVCHLQLLCNGDQTCVFNKAKCLAVRLWSSALWRRRVRFGPVRCGPETRCARTDGDVGDAVDEALRFERLENARVQRPHLVRAELRARVHSREHKAHVRRGHPLLLQRALLRFGRRRFSAQR